MDSPLRYASVQRYLSDIESSEGVRILLASAVGSHAWGLSSPESDVDLKFIFIRPLLDYLSCSRPVDSLHDFRSFGSLEDERISIYGFDIRKALDMAAESSIAFSEILLSPASYRKDPFFFSSASSLFHKNFDPVIARCQYASIVKTNILKYLSEHSFSPKVYLHTLRALFSARWIKAHSTPPPCSFLEIFEAAQLPDSPLRDAISSLVVAKKSAALPDGPPVKIIHDFITTEASLLMRTHQRPQPRDYNRDFDRIFHQCLLLQGFSSGGILFSDEPSHSQPTP
jgi:hypothetical protein